MIEYNRETLLNLLADGWTQTQIANSYHFSKQKISEDIKRMKIEWRVVRRKYRARLAEEMKRLASEGLSLEEISTKLNISYQKCRYLKKDFGIEIPDRKKRK